MASVVASVLSAPAGASFAAVIVKLRTRVVVPPAVVIVTVTVIVPAKLVGGNSTMPLSAALISSIVPVNVMVLSMTPSPTWKTMRGDGGATVAWAGEPGCVAWAGAAVAGLKLRPL